MAPVPETNGPTVADLIHAARGGDPQAMEELIRRYQDRIASFVIRETGETGQLDDLCQTIFVKMVLGLPRLRDADRFEPWLYQIARNACRDHLRRRQGWRRVFVPWQREHEAIAAEAAPTNDAEIERCVRAIERLPASQRELLRLTLESHRGYDDLARLSHSTVSTVKSRLYRARENLRRLMSKGDCE
jgi:RNA polymerase sigma-70 factor (ECF subfamily)